MGLEHPTDVEPCPTSLPDSEVIARGRFLDDLVAGLSPKIEDYLLGLSPSTRARLLRELLVAERDWKRGHGLEIDWNAYRARFPTESTVVDQLLGDDQPTVTLALRDRAETEDGLLFGLLSLANGLISPEILTHCLGAWSGQADRPLRQILIDGGYLDEGDASMVVALASKHLEHHHGVARESLMALNEAVKFRLDPEKVEDSELRFLLAEFVDGRAVAPGIDAATGLGPRYEILKHHASGGLGVVSLARDREIHREVAVKEIRPDCADYPDYRARFLREAEITGRLEHPGIVPVYGMGYRDDGRPYYIMRFIRGETLKVAIARLHKEAEAGELAGSDARHDLHSLVGRLVDACHAVAYAHHRKMLHRDLKPINIMLGPYGETLVVDWGLAKSFDGPASAELVVEEGTLRPESGSGATPTRIGSQVGTIGFMSPEQAAGRLLELGPPSDIYSLGATLYALIAGQPPFAGSGKMEFLESVAKGDFPRPRQVKPSIPRPLEAVCLKAMALRPIDRYQTAEALAEDLERWRAGEPVDAYPEPRTDRMARWAKGHKPVLASLAVLAGCAILGLAYYAERERGEKERIEAERTVTQKALGIAESERGAARADLNLTRLSLRMALDGLTGPNLAYVAGTGPARLQLANGVLQFYQDLLAKHPDDPGVRSELAHACQVTANIGRSTGDFDPGQALYAEAIGLLEPLVARSPHSNDYRIGLAVTHIEAGEHLRMTGRPRGAEDEQLKALEALKLPGGAEGRDEYTRVEARAHSDLASARLETGRPGDALSAARRSVELLAKLVEKSRSASFDRLMMVYALKGRAAARRDLGDREGSWADLEDAAKRAQALQTSQDDIDTRFALAIVLDDQGRFYTETDQPDQAIAAFDAADSILAGLWKMNQRLIFVEKERVVSWNGRGAARLASHRTKPNRTMIELALADGTNALEYSERISEKWPANYDHQGQLGRTLANLGRIALAREERGKARGLFERAIARLELALKANPEAAEEAKLLKDVSAEMKQVEAKAPTPAAGR